MRSFCRTVATLGFLALVVALAAGANEEQATTPCAECHDTLAAEFSSNPHSSALGREVASDAICVTCHAGGREHAEAGGDASLVRIPRGEPAVATCTSCHAARDINRIEPKGAHVERGVFCDSCHQIHGAKLLAESLLRANGSTLCVSCHADVRSAFRKPFTHPMHESVNGASKAGMQCASCHNPHGRSGPGTLKLDRSGELVCLSCHTDKRGPFVFAHPALVTANCLSCHEPHGSANPMLLIRSRVSQVCLECHTGLPSGTVGSQPPSLHDLRSPRYQNCTTCHVAVHGSNSSPKLLR